MLPLLPQVITYFPCSSWSSGFFGLPFCSCCCLFFFIQAAIKAPLLFAPVLSSTLHATKKAKYQFPPCNVIIFASSVVHLKKQMFNLLPGSHQVISQQIAQSHFLPTSGDTLQHISFVRFRYLLLKLICTAHKLALQAALQPTFSLTPHFIMNLT